MGSCANCSRKKVKIEVSLPFYLKSLTNSVSIYQKYYISDKYQLTLTSSKNITIKNDEKINAFTIKRVKGSNPFDSLENSSFLKILDFLKFKELQEVGKVNRKMNMLSKNWKILTKFFRNRHNKCNNLLTLKMDQELNNS